MQNSYLDDADFENPVKSYLKPYYLTSAANHSMFYYMLISNNDVILSDSKLFGAPTHTSYVETRIDYGVTGQMMNEQGETNSYIGMYIQLDDTYKVVTRQVTTFFDASAHTGGFMTVTFLIAMIIVQRMQTTIYYS